MRKKEETYLTAMRMGGLTNRHSRPFCPSRGGKAAVPLSSFLAFWIIPHMRLVVCVFLGLPLDRVMFVFGHDRRVTSNTDQLYLRYACSAIRPEHEPKQFGHEVVKFYAVVWIGMVGALGTGLDAFLDTARTYGAPSGF